MFSKTLLSTLLLAIVVAANPVPTLESHVKLSLSRHLNVTGVLNILKHDQARARHLVAKATGQLDLQSTATSEPITNDAVIYAAAVGVGNPTTTYNLIVDTGSSNTWVGAGTAYTTTSTSVKTKDAVAVSYGSGSFSGTEYTDTITLGSLVLDKQSIGVASSSSGFTGFDGILGIGPADLTRGTLSPDTGTTIPTVTDTAFSEKKISTHCVSVSFQPATENSVQNGELMWGGIDSTKYTGSIHFANVTSTYPASYYWGIDESITYGTTTILSSTAGIVDTGTTLVLIATDAFNRYQKATGSTADSATGLLKITTSQYNALKPLSFHINGQTFSLSPNAQIWPRSLNSAIGGTAGSIYLIVGDIGTISGLGLDFINGYTFLERYYTTYDTTNQRIGFAATPYTSATTN
ncbi:aspartic peptidase domain-containing protein [Amanita rubescens]|nr:aspartic peptidase domain-containing protein [Amanita rubescens]